MHFILTQLHKCIICCKHICVLKKRSTWILNKYMVCGYAMLCAYVHFLHINILIVSLNIYLWILSPIMPAKILFFAFFKFSCAFCICFYFLLDMLPSIIYRLSTRLTEGNAFKVHKFIYLLLGNIFVVNRKLQRVSGDH